MRFFFSVSEAGAIFFEVFFAAAGVFEAEGCLVATPVDEAGALPAVEAGLGGMLKCKYESESLLQGRGGDEEKGMLTEAAQEGRPFIMTNAIHYLLLFGLNDERV